MRFLEERPNAVPQMQQDGSSLQTGEGLGVKVPGRCTGHERSPRLQAQNCHAMEKQIQLIFEVMENNQRSEGHKRC